MANATEKRHAGNVTIATVRNDDEARRLTARFDSAGIKWFKIDERGVTARARGRRASGEIKIQVSGSDARRAVQLLSEKGDNSGAALPHDDSARRAARTPGAIDGWKRSAIEVGAIFICAALLAALLFY